MKNRVQDFEAYLETPSLELDQSPLVSVCYKGLQTNCSQDTTKPKDEVLHLTKWKTSSKKSFNGDQTNCSQDTTKPKGEVLQLTKLKTSSKKSFHRDYSKRYVGCMTVSMLEYETGKKFINL